MKYKDIKDKVYHLYEHIGNIDLDSIVDANDHIIDEHFDKKDFEDPINEFYITTSMCIYMIEHDLYDEYFFNAYDDLLEVNSNVSFDEDIKKDMEVINDYLIKDEIKSEYYDNLSSMYDKKDIS